MGAVLSAWPLGGEWIEVLDDASVSLVRERVRGVGAAAGLSDVAVSGMATLASELARNQLRHARGGVVSVDEVTRGGVRGVEIMATDAGPGVEDPSAALGLASASRTSASRGGGLGVGLSSALRMADELDLDVRLGEGTRIAARRFAAPPPFRNEVVVLGRPHAAEWASADGAVVVRGDAELLVCVVDGAGHGPAAREAAARALATVRERQGLSALGVVEACDAALSGTRGAVLAVARLELATREIEHVAIGNVATRIHRRGGARTLRTVGRVAGLPTRAPKVVVERAELQPGEIVAMFTDGIPSRTELPDALLREHPVRAAQHYLDAAGRATDDALVLVVR